MIRYTLTVCTAAVLLSCNSAGKQADEKAKENNTTAADTVNTQIKPVNLPEPFATASANNNSRIVDWPAGRMPVAPAGFAVNKFAGDLKNPRWIYVAGNGDIFVAEADKEGSAVDKLRGKSADRITLLRDNNGDGIPEFRSVFLKDLHMPFGMLILNNNFYVANTDGLWVYPYRAGETVIQSKGKKILDLPEGGYNNHWTRNIVGDPEGKKIYVTVGSGSNAAEHGMENEKRRADILRINPDGSGEEIFASGLRNPVGLDWAPVTKKLWAVVNERDGLGDNLVPDYLTSVKEGGFYGWPYSYFGQHEDPRLKDNMRPDLVKKAIVPDVPLISHTASLGLTFYKANSFPAKYQGGAFIGQHGSWNKSVLSGYKVAFVPFKEGEPAGDAADFLTGFIADEAKSEVYGRPVGVAVAKDGSLLVADDGSNVIWRVAAK